MKKNNISVGWLVLILLGTVALSPAYAALKAGMAVSIVTPDPLLPVSGGVGPASPSTKKLGELTVRALVLENDSVRIAIVGADFLGFPGVLGERVRSGVQDIPAQNVIIGVTHTHSAPDMYAFTNEKGETGADLKYIDSVCRKMTETINQALKDLKPARMKAVTANAGKRIAYNYYAPDLYDPRMNVLQFIETEGAGKDKAIATLINYATHPEVIGSGRGILSPDLCGPLYDRVAALGGGTALFMNSAQGGMVTADTRIPDQPGKENNDWNECNRIGNLMAERAMDMIAKAETFDNPKLACFAQTVKFPVQSPLMKAILSSSPLKFKTTIDGYVPAQMNLINLGPVQILTIPGEALPNIGSYLKRRMYGRFNLLLGLTNDAFGYMLTQVDWQAFERYAYISKTSLAEDTGDTLIREALKLIHASPKPEP